jgi:hypothetical protein
MRLPFFALLISCWAAAPARPEESQKPEMPSTPSMVQLFWTITRDSDGNIRRQYKLEGDIAVRGQARIGLAYDEMFVNNILGLALNGETESYVSAAVTGQWQPNTAFKFDGSVGLARLGNTLDLAAVRVPHRLIPTANLLGHITAADEAVQVDFGFNRTVYDLSPQLIMNRVIRNEFVFRPGVALPSGWRFRLRSEMGSMTGDGEDNGRFNSEFTVARVLGKDTELYVTYGNLHYTKASDLGYSSPDRVETYEAGWTTDHNDKKKGVNLDFAIGAGHARDHDDRFGPWGISVRAQSEWAWKYRPGREVHASMEYDYNQFNPALLVAPAKGGWSMCLVSVFFRWTDDTPRTLKTPLVSQFRSTVGTAN